jgi:hypothetical protein
MIFPKETCVAIYESEGRPIEIDWPESSVIPVVGRAYSMQSSRNAGKLSILVERVIEDGLRAEVRIATAVELPVYLGKSGGYTTRGSHAMRTFRAAGESNGTQIPAEGEPEPLTRSEAAEMARRTRFERIQLNREKLRDLYESLADLQDDPDFSKHKSDVKFMRSLAHKLEAGLAKDDACYLADLQEAS